MAEGSNSPAEGYLDWAQEELGVVVHHPLRVSSTPGKEERGVFCEENIPAETIIVSVPWEVGEYMNQNIVAPIQIFKHEGGCGVRHTVGRKERNT